MSVKRSRIALAALFATIVGAGAVFANDLCNPCSAPVAPAPAPVVVQTAAICDPCAAPVAPAPVVMPAVTVSPCNPCAPAPRPVIRTRYAPVVSCDPCRTAKSGRSWRWFGWFRPTPRNDYYAYNRYQHQPYYRSTAYYR